MNQWKEVDNILVRTFEFADFNKAWSFLEKVAEQARKHNHHPTIENTYNKVTLTLTTHDEDDQVTQKDRDLAASINSIL